MRSLFGTEFDPPPKELKDLRSNAVTAAEEGDTRAIKELQITHVEQCKLFLDKLKGYQNLPTFASKDKQGKKHRTKAYEFLISSHQQMTFMGADAGYVEYLITDVMREILCPFKWPKLKICSDMGPDIFAAENWKCAKKINETHFLTCHMAATATRSSP